MAKVLDVRTELERAPLSAGHWTLVGVLALVTLFDGYDVFVAGSVIPFVMKLWGLKPAQAGLLVSSGLVGFMIGSLIGGPIADRIGRKPTLLGGLIWAGLLNLCTAAFARDLTSFIGFRLATGIGLGMLLPLAVTLINETAPRKATNLLVGCVMIGWSGGGILAALAGGTLGRAYGWPALFWAAGVGVPLALLCWLVLRESPRFLALRDRQDALLSVMQWLNPSAGYGGARFALDEDNRRRGSISRLLAPDVRQSTLVVWLCAACSLFAIYGLSSWLPQTMIQRGESFGAGFAFAALLQFMAVLGGVGCGWAADRLPRKGVLAGSWILGGLAIGGLALFNLHWTNIAFVSVAGFFIMGAQPVLNNFVASLYPTEVRSTGVGVELGVGRLGGILGPYIGGWLQQLYGGAGAMFLAMAAVLLLSAASLPLARLRSPQGASR
jgi:AAHS family 4-hydroxybenzoate transporter-like MFS transporter